VVISKILNKLYKIKIIKSYGRKMMILFYKIVKVKKMKNFKFYYAIKVLKEYKKGVILRIYNYNSRYDLYNKI
jgi:hypothetical protein